MKVQSFDLERKENELVAIMFADIANYTAIMQQSEAKAKELLDHFQSILNRLIPRFSGEIVNTYGDGCLIKFYSAESALKAAQAAQIEFTSASSQVPVRIGIHLGDVFQKDGNIYGNNVNIASRIESFSVPGSVLFSEEIYDQIANKESFEHKALGKFKIKNDNKTRTLYALTGRGLVVPRRTSLKGKGKLRTNTASLMLISVLVVIGLISLYFFSTQTASSNSNTDISLAVLPLKNLNSIEENLEYYSDGLTAEIIDELTKIKSFAITSFTQSVYYKNQTIPAKTIAKELDVNFIVSGSVRLLPGEIIKLSVELFNPKTNKRIWYKNFEDSVNNAPTFQTAIAREIADNLNITLSEDEEASLGRLNTVDGDAFRFFLKAKSEMDKFTEAGFSKADEFLDKAISIDSSYAQAYTLKAWNLVTRADPTILPSLSREKNGLEQVDGLLSKSLQLRPDYSDTYLVRSSYSLYVNNKIQDAIDDVEHAIRLKSWPRVPTNYCTCTMISAMISGHHFSRAREIIHIAEDVDPDNIFQSWDKGSIEMAQGNFKEAEAYFREAYTEMPHDYFRTYLAMALYHLSQYDDVISLYTDVEYTDPELSLLSLAYLSNTHYQIGNKAESDRLKDLIHARDEMGNTNLYTAIIYLGRGKYDVALQYFEKSYALNEYGIATLTSTDPVFKPLQSFQRYLQIRKEMQFSE